MIAEVGQFWLIITMVLSVVAVCSVSYGMLISNETMTEQWEVSRAWKNAIFPLSFLGSLFSLLSISALGYGFYSDDFSIRYIAEHSNSALPVFFKIAAIWGGHEGSLLFWVFILTLWTGTISIKRKHIQEEYVVNVALILNILIAIFSAFTLFASNPFIVYKTPLFEGRDLNPMLQDIGLIFHPPLLYLGYVGFAVTFSFAFSALMMKGLPEYWITHARRWTLIAWSFLTFGIGLGSWWAYYELGWGGWWFWDPVENVSLLPWLSATALLHSFIMSEKYKQLLKVSIILSLTTFCFSILGTFVVRSGILTSVHAFTSDPTRGTILLLILVLICFISLLLYLIKSQQINSQVIKTFTSLNFLFLLFIGLLSIATITVLLGTFYPMLFEVFGLGKISVGAPYFIFFFAPLSLLVLCLMAISLFFNWEHNNNRVHYQYLPYFGLSMIVGLIIYRFQYQELYLIPMLTWMLSIVVGTGSFITFLNRKKLGVLMAHIGVAVMMIGVAMNSYHSFEETVKMSPGVKLRLSDYELEYQETELLVGPNYTAEQANLQITNEGNKIGQITPQRRHYQVRVMNMSEPAIHWFWHGDIYVTLGEKLNDGSFVLRLQYKAYVRWIWLGAILMGMGGLFSIMNRQHRVRENRA